jgi:4-azaleucine resistance transporter AzlC
VYWVTGSVLGAFMGSVVKFNSEGIDFALTALFLTVFIEQWLSTKKHAPAIIGIVVSVICLVLFGKDNFLIPAMMGISIMLCLDKEEKNNA